MQMHLGGAGGRAHDGAYGGGGCAVTYSHSRFEFKRKAVNEVSERVRSVP